MDDVERQLDMGRGNSGCDGERGLDRVRDRGFQGGSVGEVGGGGEGTEREVTG